jgi:hypothetical protein
MKAFIAFAANIIAVEAFRGTLGTPGRPMHVVGSGIGGGGAGTPGAGGAMAGAGAAEAAAEGGAKAGGKALVGKALGKLLPGLGLAFGAYDSYSRVKEGDYLGGGIAAASGLASLIPVFGTAAALALDAVNIGRDLGKSATDDKHNETVPSGASAGDPDPSEKLITAVETLNNHMVDLKRYMLQTANNTKNAVTEIHHLSGDLYPRPH